MASEDLASHPAWPARAGSALHDLGAALKQVRTVVLRRNGPEMAEWLGIATRRPDGRPTSTGKALVSQFEKGRRLPDEAVLEQYCRAPGTDVDRLRDLYAAARAATTPTVVADGTAGSGDPADPEPRPDRSSPRHRLRPAVVVGVLVVALAVVAAVVIAVIVSRSRGDEPATPRGSATAPLAGVQLVFDALGPTSDQTINVYPGYTTAKADRQSDLAYHSGEKAAVVCEVQGRPVASDPAAGERYRSSDIWVRIRTGTGLIRYATLTYARFVPASAKVPMCSP